MGGRPRVRFQGFEDQAQYDPPCTNEPVEPGYICGTLGPDETLRVELQLVPGTGLVRRDDSSPVEPLLPDAGVNLSSVLQKYGPMTVRDKIVLAHTVAQAFWQLYASDLMRSAWTSESIWFMPEDNARDDDSPGEEIADALPMNAYVAFDFSPYNPVQEWLDPISWRNNSATHRFPHMLALGVLLLEIGLGRPVGTPEIKDLLGRGSVARLASKFKSGLKSFNDVTWDGFIIHKDCFTGVIEYCTTYKNWICSQQPAKAVSSGASRLAAPVSDEDRLVAISRRKELLYKNVIRPLAWLAQAFYEDHKYVTCTYSLDPLYLPRRQEASGLREESLSELGRLLKSDNTSSRWLTILEKFNVRTFLLNQKNVGEMKAQEGRGHDTTEIQATFKVAILDTGYNPNMPFFQNPERRKQLAWNDFIPEAESRSSTPVDKYGHGSFMAQLVMTSSPLAQVYVARVAQDLDRLSRSKDAIAEVGGTKPFSESARKGCRTSDMPPGNSLGGYHREGGCHLNVIRLRR